MSDTSVVANPGAGGAFFKVDQTAGTSTPYMLMAGTTQIFGSVGVSSGAFTGQVSSFPIGTTQVFGQISTFPHSLTGTSMVNIVSSVPLGFTPTGTSMVNIVSSVALGFTPVGTSQVFGQVSSFPIGTTFANVMSSVPHALVGTSMVNIVSSVALGFTPTGTSMVNIVSSVALGFTPTGTSFVTISSSNLLAPLNLISSNVFVDNSAFVPGTSRLGVIGGYYTSTAVTLAHLDAGAALMNSSSQIIIAPGSAEGFASTQAVVFTAVVDGNGNQVTNFGSGTQYVNNAATSQPTGMVQMWASGAGNSTIVAVASSRPIPMNIVSSIALGFTPTGTSFVTISSSQVAFGGGTQYVEGNTTTNPTGTAMLWKSAVSTMVSVSSSQPLPMNIVSSVALGFTPTGTSFVTLSSTQVGFAVTGQVSTFANNVASTFTVGGSTAVNPISLGGLDVVWYPSVTTAPRTIKNSAGRVYDIWFTNNATSVRWLKLYNASSASVSTGTTVPTLAFGLPALTTSYTLAASGWLGSAMGLQFSTAAAVSVTASSQTTGDTSAPNTNEVNLVFGFK